MIFKPYQVTFKTNNNIKDILYILRGLTEENDDKFSVVPLTLYKFQGSFNQSVFHLELLTSWMFKLFIDGNIIEDISGVTVILDVQYSKRAQVETIIVNLLILSWLFFGYPKPNWSVLIIIIPILLLFFIADQFVILSLKRKINKIFKNIINKNFKEEQLKYIHKQ